MTTDRRPTADRIADCIADHRALMAEHRAHMTAGRYYAARTAACEALQAIEELPLTDDVRALLRSGVAAMKAAASSAAAAREARIATARGTTR